MATGDLLNVAVVFSAVDKMTRPISRMTAGMSKLEQSIYYTDRYMSDLFVKGSIGAVAMTGAIYKLVEAYSWVETATINMATALRGNLELAYDLMDEIRDLAENSPLTAKPLAQSANVLLSYGIPETQLMDTLKRLGDLAKGQDDVLQTLAMGFGRIVAEDRITREHLDRFIFKGNIPIYDALAKSLGISMEQLREEMQAGRLGGKELIGAIEYLTDEGGQFYNAMEKLNMTLQGQSQQFLEKGGRLLGSIGQILTPFITRALFSVFNPFLVQARDIVEKYLAPTRETVSQPDGSKLIRILDTETTERIVKKLEDLVFAISIDVGWIEDMFERLKDGTSFFYDFIDVLIAFVKGVKFAIGSLKIIIDFVNNSAFAPFIKGLLKLGAFLLPIAFIFVKIGALGVSVFTIFKGFFGMLMKIPALISVFRAKLTLLTPFLVRATGTIFLNILKVIQKVLGRGIATALLNIGARIAPILASQSLKLIPVIGQIILVIDLIRMLGGWLYKTFDGVRSAINSFIMSIYNIGQWFIDLGSKIGIFGYILQWVGNTIIRIGNFIYSFFAEGFLGVLKTLFVEWGLAIADKLLVIIRFVISAISKIPGIDLIPGMDKAKQWAESNPLEPIRKLTEEMREDKQKEKEKEKIVVPPPQVIVNNNITTESPVSNVETATKFNYNPNKLANGLSWS